MPRLRGDVVSETVSDARLAELIVWLDRKWARHHEEEDLEAANALREFQSRRSSSPQGMPFKWVDGPIYYDLKYLLTSTMMGDERFVYADTYDSAIASLQQQLAISNFERDAACDQVKDWSARANDMCDQRDSALAKLAAAEVDAARYRWIRDFNVPDIHDSMPSCPCDYEKKPHELDAAIDAALSQGGSAKA